MLTSLGSLRSFLASSLTGSVGERTGNFTLYAENSPGLTASPGEFHGYCGTPRAQIQFALISVVYQRVLIGGRETTGSAGGGVL